MPWTPADARRHNHRAAGIRARQWADVANSVLKHTGDEGRAVREANGVIKPFVNTDAKHVSHARRVVDMSEAKSGEANPVAPHMIGGWS